MNKIEIGQEFIVRDDRSLKIVVSSIKKRIILDYRKNKETSVIEHIKKLSETIRPLTDKDCFSE